MDKIINTHLKTYLIGPMEKVASGDNGRGWRDKLRPDLETLIDENGNTIYIFDPTIEENNKTGMTTKELHSKMDGWISAGHIDKVIEGMDIIWRGKTFTKKTDDEKRAELIHLLGDIDYVRNSDFIIARLEENDSPCGTYGEALLAFERKIPIYLIQTMPKSKYNKSFLGWVYGSGGDIFDNPTQLIDFLKKKYKLKEKK